MYSYLCTLYNSKLMLLSENLFSIVQINWWRSLFFFKFPVLHVPTSANPNFWSIIHQFANCFLKRWRMKNMKIKVRTCMKYVRLKMPWEWRQHNNTVVDSGVINFSNHRTLKIQSVSAGWWPPNWSKIYIDSKTCQLTSVGRQLTCWSYQL